MTERSPFYHIPVPRDSQGEIRTRIRNLENDIDEVTEYHRDPYGFETKHTYKVRSKFHTPDGWGKRR